jgi:hypothetical protein
MGAIYILTLSASRDIYFRNLEIKLFFTFFAVQQKTSLRVLLLVTQSIYSPSCKRFPSWYYLFDGIIEDITNIPTGVYIEGTRFIAIGAGNIL